jgi:hypothetical protein
MLLISPPYNDGRSAVGAALVRSYRLLTSSLVRAACGRLPVNRRREIRKTIGLGCRARRVDDWRLVGDRTVDLSPQGMLLLSDERIAEGTGIVVSFQTTELPLWFDTCAVVARVVEGRRPGDHGRALGIHFESLPPVSRLLLRGYLSKMPPAPAARELPLDLTRAA